MTKKIPVVTGLELVRVLEEIGGTLKSILKDADMTVDEFRKLL